MIERKAMLVVTTAFTALLLLSMLGPAFAGSSTTQSTKLTLQVYPDASVRWVGEYSKTTNESAYGYILANLTQLEKGLKLVVNASINNFTKVSNAAIPAELTLNVKGKTESTENFIKSLTNFNVYINDEKDNLKVKAWSNVPVKTVFNKSNLYDEITGNVSVTASGNNAIGIIFVLSLLNKNYIENQLAKANITFIDIKKLDTTTGPNGATIVFDIGINYTKMLKELSNSSTTQKVNAQKLKDLLETYFAPYNATYAISTYISRDKITLHVNVNSTLSVMQAANLVLKIMGKFSELYGNTTHVTTPHTAINMSKGITDVKKFLKDINDTINKFEILPSSAYVLVTFANHKVHIRFQTFKIRAKGAKSPEDTLRTLSEVLQNLKTKLSNTTLESSEGKEAKSAIDTILGGKAVIEGVGGVKVSPTEIPLSELGNVKVTVVNTTTSTSATETSTTVVTSITETTSTATTVVPSSTTSSVATTVTTSSSTTTAPTSTSTTSTTSTSATTPTSTTSTSITSTTTPAQTSGISSTLVIAGVIAAAIIVGAVVAIIKIKK